MEKGIDQFLFERQFSKIQNQSARKLYNITRLLGMIPLASHGNFSPSNFKNNFPIFSLGGIFHFNSREKFQMIFLQSQHFINRSARLFWRIFRKNSSLSSSWSLKICSLNCLDNSMCYLLVLCKMSNNLVDFTNFQSWKKREEFPLKKE